MLLKLYYAFFLVTSGANILCGLVMPRKTCVGGLVLIAFLALALPFLAFNLAINYYDNLTLTAVPYERRAGILKYSTKYSTDKNWSRGRLHKWGGLQAFLRFWDIFSVGAATGRGGLCCRLHWLLVCAR